MKRHILILLFFSINLFAQNEIIRRLQLDAAFDTLLTHLVNPSTVRLAEYDRVLTNQQVDTIITSSCRKSFCGVINELCKRYKKFCQSKLLAISH